MKQRYFWGKKGKKKKTLQEAWSLEPINTNHKTGQKKKKKKVVV